MLEIRNFSWQDEKIKAILQRSEEVNKEVSEVVKNIVENIHKNGDQALIKYVNEFDAKNINLENIRVTEKELIDAKKQIDDDFLTAITLARVNIRKFHKYQKRSSYVHDDGEGVKLAKKVMPLARVGVYCPAGTAPLFSSLLMNVIPAQIAGVKEIVAAIPPRKDGTIDPHMLVTAQMLDIKDIYKMGGAQAIAALAYGTESIKKVDKIVGPGNSFVTAAKRMVFGTVGIDAIAGPSEIVIIADDTASAKFVAADLLSQLEHGSGYESGVVLTTERDLAAAIKIEVNRMLEKLERTKEITKALKKYSAVFLCNSLSEAADVSNAIAPEHLEIMTKDNQDVLDKIDNAGAVFLGPWSSEPIGDYFAGTNHVLPTGGAARFSSSLSVYDFVKDISVIEYTAKRLEMTGRHIVKLAEAEGLTAHANAVKQRLIELKK